MDVYKRRPQKTKLEALKPSCKRTAVQSSLAQIAAEVALGEQLWGCESISDETLSRAALSAAQHERYTRALVILNYIIDRNPSAVHYSNRGLVYLWSGQVEQALADCDYALRINPQLEQAYNNRANCYAALNRWEEAISDYDRAVDLNPFNVRARVNLGVTFRDQGKYSAALEVFDEALLFRQLPEHVYTERGRTYHLRGDWNCAIADYHRALSTLSRTESVTAQKLKQRVQGWLDELLSSN
ncbi:MAG TPA: tetratricopeptide repeat protein [Leptolyngbyaceae cyanobacterium]